jgi:hypothetical protein
VGTWIELVPVALTPGVGSATLTVTLTLDAGGTASETVTATSSGGIPCMGVQETTGMTWSATTSAITLIGFNLTGEVGCPNVGWGDTVGGGSGSPTCAYSLSNDDETLLLTCPTAKETFQRQ